MPRGKTLQPHIHQPSNHKAVITIAQHISFGISGASILAKVRLLINEQRR